MLIFRIERKKIYLYVSILVCLCMALVILYAYPGRKMSIAVFLASSDAKGEKPENVEIFDIEAGLVRGNFRNNSVFRKEACKYLDSITGMYGNVKVFPDAGYIVKIPLEPSVETSSKLLEAAGIVSIDTVYVVFPAKGQPYLLILDGQSRPLCFNLDADTTLLQKYAAGYIKKYMPQKPPEYSMEELYYDISMSVLLPYIQKAVVDYYAAGVGISPVVDPWQPDILYIERPNSYRTYLFKIKLEVLPYIGPHRSVGKDRITLEVSTGEVKIIEYEHVENYPTKP